MLDKYSDYKIICVDCLTYAGNMSTLKKALENPNFTFLKIDITDRDAIYKMFEEQHPDIVVNFAAESHVDRSIENPCHRIYQPHIHYVNLTALLKVFPALLFSCCPDPSW